MRRKRWMRGGGAIILSLIITSAMALVVAAAAPEPNYEAGATPSVTVDGIYSEWDTTDPSDDFFAEMYEAGNPSKDALSTLYLRYNCTNQTLYALVLAKPGVTVDPGSVRGEHFIKVKLPTGKKWDKLVDENTGDDDPDDPPDFHFIYDSSDNRIGWEASASLTGGTVSSPAEYDLNVHTNVNGGKTSAVASRNIDLRIACPGPTAVTLSSLSASASGNAWP
ncbi:MAG: hypothetical protein J7M34_10885, partial [Anaerolineae bacterium]|nr:hypothetical protein [Anaerolineae bacterium]